MAKCGTGGHEDKAQGGGHKRRGANNWRTIAAGSIGRIGGGGGNSLIGLVSSLALLIMILLASKSNTADARTTTITNEKPALNDDDDLIEGRLDSSGLCGTRWPTGGGGGGGGHRQLKSGTQQKLLANNSLLEPDQRFAESEEPRDNLLYIVGGDEVDDEQLWPWSVAIYELDPLNGQRSFICSGSLISEKFVLTAAHCIQQSRFDILTPDEIFLKIASIRLDDERSDFYRVERIHIHPNYMVDRKTSDIALLRLSRYNQRLPQRARPICLPSSVANRIDFTNQEVTIIGWGKTSAMQGNEPSRLIDIGRAGEAAGSSRQSAERLTNELSPAHENGTLSRHAPAPADDQAGQTDDTLLQAHVRVTSTDQCNKDYSKLEISWLQIDEHFLCASDPQGKRDACQGDSGGPLMWNDNNLYGNRRRRRRLNGGAQEEAAAAAAAQEKWYQLGLVSFGYGCANRQYPGVYTRIAYYMPWILKTVNEREVAAGNHLNGGGGGVGGHMLSTMINHNHHKQQQQQQQQLGPPANSFRPAALHHQGRN